MCVCVGGGVCVCGGGIVNHQLEIIIINRKKMFFFVPNV